MPTKVRSPPSAAQKGLGFQPLFFLSFGSIIGSGWLFATLSAGAVAGPAVLLSWLVAAVLVIFIALNYAEVMKRVADSGTGLIVRDELEGGDEAEPAGKSAGLP